MRQHVPQAGKSRAAEEAEEVGQGSMQGPAGLEWRRGPELCLRLPPSWQSTASMSPVISIIYVEHPGWLKRLRQYYQCPTLPKKPEGTREVLLCHSLS